MQGRVSSGLLGAISSAAKRSAFRKICRVSRMHLLFTGKARGLATKSVAPALSRRLAAGFLFP
jgi:hypothetical protein